VAKNGIPTQQQQTQIIEALREKKELSLRGFFKPMFLTGDITVEDPKVQAMDAAMLASRIQNRHEIFLTFGVPPSMADKMESYSIGSASDWYILIFETCIPTGEKIAPYISQVVKVQTGQDLEVDFGWDEHPVMQAVRRERIDGGLKLWAAGMPMEKINEYLELGLPEFDGWEVGYLPFSVAPVGEVESGETDPASMPEFSEQEDAEETEKKGISNFKSQISKGRRERDRAHWRKQMASRQPIIRGFEAKFNKELMGARAIVLRKLDAWRTKGFHVTKAAAADFIFNLGSFTDGLKIAMRKQAGVALQTAGEQVFEELKRDDPWKTAPEEVRQFFHTRENRIVDVAQEVFEDVQENLQEGIDAGESIDDLSKRVRSQFSEMSHERSTRIAMTETAAAFGVGRQEAMAKAGVTEKRWLTSGNDNVRDAHRAANGQTVGIDEAFEVGGEQLMHPGDPSGSPENVINCHCVAVPVA
jgi:SPP1 gp7 family putative phage head morphogenesis protein